MPRTPTKDDDDTDDPGTMKIKVKAKIPANQPVKVTITPQKKRKSLIDTMTGLRS